MYLKLDFFFIFKFILIIINYENDLNLLINDWCLKLYVILIKNYFFY